MEYWRFKVVYLVLLPAIVVSACILGYFSYQTATQLIQLGERSIVHSILLLVENRVQQMENQIIAADNEVFRNIDLNDPKESVRSWKLKAESTTPSIRAVIVLDSNKAVVEYAARASRRDKKLFLAKLLRRIVPELKLESLKYNKLKHLHQLFGGSNYLISYKSVHFRGERCYLLAHHDIGYLVRDVFPKLFTSESGKQLYSVVNEDNKRVFGPNLAHAGDYLVGRRFPTTLYNWRLQVAPQEAPLLKSKERTSRLNQAALIGLSLGIILLGTLFILFAAMKERKLNTLKSEFIANVSHELKTPLSVIRMFGEMLLTGRVRSQDKQQQYLENICSESERLSGLIENVLDFAVLERGRPHYKMHDCDLYELVAAAVDTFHYRFEREGAKVNLRQIGNIPPVRVDQQAIMLCVINLLDNAVKYGASTPIEVTIQSREKEILVRVRDYGPGIQPGDLKRVFERFYRTRDNPKARGTGIGLTLVKQIAEAHQGRAWASNAEGGGAVVSIALPYQSNSSSKSASELKSENHHLTNVSTIHPKVS